MRALTKTKTLLYLSTWKEPHYFGVSEEGVDSSVVRLDMNEEKWRDMDCPSTITVTIEPGDLLNEEPK